jgi:hypothetical protein
LQEGQPVFEHKTVFPPRPYILWQNQRNQGGLPGAPVHGEQGHAFAPANLQREKGSGILSGSGEIRGSGRCSCGRCFFTADLAVTFFAFAIGYFFNLNMDAYHASLQFIQIKNGCQYPFRGISISAL